MPVVVGTQVVPPNIPRPTGWDYYGQFGGDLSRKVVDALLAAFLGQGGGFGRVPTTPTPQRPGQLTFPSGATTPTSPQELAQIQALGGVPSRGGGMVPMGQPQTGGVSYTQPTRLGMKPDLQQLIRQQQIDEARQRQALIPLEQKKLEEENRLLSARADLKDKAARGEIEFQTLPDGTIVPVVPSTSGPRMNPKNPKSAREQVAEEEFSSLAKTAPDSGLWRGRTYKVGEAINVKGTRYRVVGFDTDGTPLLDPA